MLARASILAALAAVALVAAGVGRTGPAQEQPAAVTCDLATRVSNAPPTTAPRIVLGRVALPRQAAVVELGRRGYTKLRLYVRAGEPLTVSVPSSHRKVYALSYNGSGTTVANGPKELRFEPCAESKGRWTTFSGGLLINKAACVPLAVRVGERSATARIGIGKRCS